MGKSIEEIQQEKDRLEAKLYEAYLQQHKMIVGMIEYVAKFVYEFKKQPNPNEEQETVIQAWNNFKNGKTDIVPLVEFLSEMAEKKVDHENLIGYNYQSYLDDIAIIELLRAEKYDEPVYPEAFVRCEEGLVFNYPIDEIDGYKIVPLLHDESITNDEADSLDVELALVDAPRRDLDLFFQIEELTDVKFNCTDVSNLMKLMYIGAFEDWSYMVCDNNGKHCVMKKRLTSSQVFSIKRKIRALCEAMYGGGAYKEEYQEVISEYTNRSSTEEGGSNGRGLLSAFFELLNWVLNRMR